MFGTTKQAKDPMVGTFNNRPVYRDDIGLYLHLGYYADGSHTKMYILNEVYPLDKIIKSLQDLNEVYQESKKTPADKLAEAVRGHVHGPYTYSDLSRALDAYEDSKKKELTKTVG